LFAECPGQIHDFFIFIFGVLMPLSNISAISWRPVLVVEEARENH
jgi:hypothetical protein